MIYIHPFFVIRILQLQVGLYLFYIYLSYVIGKQKVCFISMCCFISTHCRTRRRPEEMVGFYNISGRSLGACPESEKPSRRVGIADRKGFARPESFCACLQNWPQKQVKNSISLERFWTIWKVSGQSGKFLDSLESFRTVWKVLG